MVMCWRDVRIQENRNASRELVRKVKHVTCSGGLRGRNLAGRGLNDERETKES